MSTKNLQELNNDCLVHALCFLEPLQIVRLQLISTEFQDVSLHASKIVFMEGPTHIYYEDRGFIDFLLKHKCVLKRIVFDCHEYVEDTDGEFWTYRNFLRSVTHLETLQIPAPDKQEHQHELWTAFQNMPFLTELKLVVDPNKNERQVVDLSEIKCDLLTSFAVIREDDTPTNHNFSLPLPSLNTFLQHHSRLRSLTLSGVDLRTLQLKNVFPDIQDIDLRSNTPNGFPHKLDVISRAFPHVKSLGLWGVCFDLSDLVSSFKCFQNISIADPLDYINLETWPTTLTRLISVELSFDAYKMDPCGDNLEQCRESLSVICDRAPNLVNLRLVDFEMDFGDAAMLEKLLKLDRLENLYIKDISDVSGPLYFGQACTCDPVGITVDFLRLLLSEYGPSEKKCLLFPSLKSFGLYTYRKVSLFVCGRNLMENAKVQSMKNRLEKKRPCLAVSITYE